jgi:hypothetical protein
MQDPEQSVKSMQEKKAYSTPLLTIHGDVEVITQIGGVSVVDAPTGTPIGNCCS